MTATTMMQIKNNFPVEIQQMIHEYASMQDEFNNTIHQINLKNCIAEILKAAVVRPSSYSKFNFTDNITYVIRPNANHVNYNRFNLLEELNFYLETLDNYSPPDYESEHETDNEYESEYDSDTE